MARHEASRAVRAEKCMFAALTLADQTAKRSCSSVSYPRLKTGMDVGVCCCVCVLRFGMDDDDEVWELTLLPRMDDDDEL